MQQISESMNAVPWQVATSIFFVHGRPSFKTNYLVARLNSSNVLRGRLNYKEIGKPGTDSYGKYAWGIESQTGEELTGPEVTLQLAKAEGWYDRKGSKWRTMPGLMLQYRAASFWINTHAPEIAMGMTTYEELKDVEIKDINEPRNIKTPARPNVYDVDDFEQKKPIENFENNQSKTTVIEMDYDKATGEIIESPAFVTLKKELQTIKTLGEIDQFASSPLTKKISAAEKYLFVELIRDRCDELKRA